MQVDVHRNSILECPARFTGIASTKIYDDDGNLIVIAMQHGAAVIVITADDKDFESVCKQYSISAVRAEAVET